MSEPIKPALTPEEWRAKHRPQYWQDGRASIRLTGPRGLRVSLDTLDNHGESVDNEMVEIVPEDAPVVAALALQIAGAGAAPLFTWEHVRWLREMAANFDLAMRGLEKLHGRHPDAQQAESLAACIAALLPPE